MQQLYSFTNTSRGKYLIERSRFIFIHMTNFYLRFKKAEVFAIFALEIFQTKKVYLFTYKSIIIKKNTLNATFVLECSIGLLLKSIYKVYILNWSHLNVACAVMRLSKTVILTDTWKCIDRQNNFCQFEIELN